MMNERQIQYALELAKVKSFSLAAEKLNISQPSLSKQIQSLENHLGVKLFDRSCVPMRLTPAGEYFLRRAKELLYQEDQLLRSMEDYKTEEKGRLTIGISPFRNLCLMPGIIARFQKRYPDVQIVLRESSSDQLRREAAEGSFDFAIVNLPVDQTMLDTIPLKKEHLVIAVPANLMHHIDPDVAAAASISDFSSFKELPFVVLGESQEMRRYFDSLCAQHDITPRVAIEVAGGVTSALSMARAGIGATLLPMQLLDEHLLAEDLTLFTIQDPAYDRQPVIVTRRGQFLSAYARYAIDLLLE